VRGGGVGEGAVGGGAWWLLRGAGAEPLAWLPGERAGVPEIMRALDLFVLPSLAEGISNTILEAMASGLPVVATTVGGNPELVEDGVTGTLVAPGDPQGMAAALRVYAESADLCRRRGQAALATIEERFRMDAMMSAYLSVYDNLLAGARAAHTARRIA